MDTPELLTHFNRLADAPGAIPRLRRLVLDLAVRGKLVAQDPGDEPASVLLERIAAEKTRLVARGELKLDRPIRSSIDGDSRFRIPAGWQWIKLQEVFNSISDGDHQPPPKADSGVSFLVIGDVRNKVINYQSERKVPNAYYEGLDPIRKPRRGDLLYTLVGSFGIPIIVREDQPFCVQRHIAILRPSSLVVIELISAFMESGFVFDQAENCATGIAQKTVPLSGLRAIALPLPPLAEQHRIVAKVDELMGLLDQIEARQTAREATRRQFTTASLASLSASDTSPDDFRDYARFLLDHLPANTTRREQIKQLRQTILNLAVRGRLVPQDSSEAPIVVSSTIKSDQCPFELPKGWVWAELGDLCTKTGSGSTPRGGKEVYRDSGIPFLRSQNIYNDGLKLDDVAFIDPGTHARMIGTRVEPGDLLLNITGGSIGRCAVVASGLPEANVSQHVAIIRPEISAMAAFLHKVIISPHFQAYVFGEQTGAGRGGLPKNRMDRIPIPIPPLAEQHRIVAKVDELMALCDHLDAALDRAETHRTRLLDAELHAALQDREAA